MTIAVDWDVKNQTKKTNIQRVIQLVEKSHLLGHPICLNIKLKERGLPLRNFVLQIGGVLELF